MVWSTPTPTTCFVVVAIVAVVVVLWAWWRRWRRRPQSHNRRRGGRRPTPPHVVLRPLPPEVVRCQSAIGGHVERRDLETARATAANPPVLNRLNVLAGAFVREGRWDALVEIGSIYSRGSYPLFRPDKATANSILIQASMAPDIAAAAMARFELAHVHDAGGIVDVAVDRAGATLPTGPADMVIAAARRMLAAGGDREQQTRRGPPPPPPLRTSLRVGPPFFPHPPPPPPPPPPPLPNFHDVLPRLPLWFGDRAADDVVLGPLHLPPAPAFTGRQSVHDHGVQCVLAKSLTTLQERYDADEDVDDEAMNALRTAIKDHPILSGTDKAHAERVLGQMLSRVHGERLRRHTRLGVTEPQVASLVWQRICDIPDPDVRMNAIETLGKQLATGVEMGTVVCSTGRITRAIGALEGVVEDVDASLTTDAIRLELATTAAKVREDVLRAASHEDVEAYESGNPCPKIEEKMRVELGRRAHDTYVHQLGMSKGVLDPLVQMYADEF